MNESTLREVHPNDLPQRVRKRIHEEMRETEDGLRLKLAINQLCWEQLPGNITLRECELIACKIFRIMHGNDLGVSESDMQEHNRG